jgi:hypothetical protein
LLVGAVGAVVVAHRTHLATSSRNRVSNNKFRDRLKLNVVRVSLVAEEAVAAKVAEAIKTLEVLKIKPPPALLPVVVV